MRQPGPLLIHSLSVDVLPDGMKLVVKTRIETWKKFHSQRRMIPAFMNYTQS